MAIMRADEVETYVCSRRKRKRINKDKKKEENEGEEVRS